MTLKTRNKFEKVLTAILFVAATLSVVAVLLISVFLFYKGLPLFSEVSVFEFLFSSSWDPTNIENPQFGILSFIVGSIYVTSLALIISIPIGLAAGVYLTELAERKMSTVIRSAIELLAGIPSVVYGLFGIVLITRLSAMLFGGTGYNVLSASLVLAIMILPTIINITEVSIREIPTELKAASFALGATHWQTIYKVMLPAARRGIIAGIILGMGRALGETTAVIMVAGNAPLMPVLPTDMVRTLTMNILTDMSYATGSHQTALFTTGIVLFIFILLLNILVQLVLNKSINKSAEEK